MGAARALTAARQIKTKVMGSGAARAGAEARTQRMTKARLTQLCYHLYAGSTLFFLTE